MKIRNPQAHDYTFIAMNDELHFKRHKQLMMILRPVAIILGEDEDMLPCFGRHYHIVFNRAQVHVDASGGNFFFQFYDQTGHIKVKFLGNTGSSGTGIIRGMLCVDEHISIDDYINSY